MTGQAVLLRASSQTLQPDARGGVDSMALQAGLRAGSTSGGGGALISRHFLPRHS